jgi:hypothetical protein
LLITLLVELEDKLDCELELIDDELFELEDKLDTMELELELLLTELFEELEIELGALLELVPQTAPLTLGASATAPFLSP